MKRTRIENFIIGKYSYDVFFVLGFLFLSAIFYNGFNELSELPKGMHQWKQSMHFSIIQNYTDSTAGFWHPSMNNLFNSDSTGKLILEFPIFHKITATIISFFPDLNPAIFRWIIFILTFIGFYHAYKLAGLILKNELLALLSSFLIFAIPVVVFYGANYLVDVPAMAFGFSAIYFFEKNTQKVSLINGVFGFLFLVLSGLLRLPVLVLPIAYFGARIIYRKNIVQLLWILPSLLIIVTWYYYVKKYNTYFVSYPPTETYSYLSPERVSSTIQSISNFIIYQLGWSYRFLMFYVLVSMYLAINWRKVSRFWCTVLLFAIAGSTVYVYLWFGILEHHDYYLFPIIPVIFLIWLNVFYVVINTKYSQYALYFAIVILGINTINTFDNMRLRTYRKSIKVAHVFTGRYESGIWWYFGNEDNEKWKVLRTISPYNRSKVLENHGVFSTDTVICDFDPSPTYSLALLKLKGWTLYNSSFSSLDDYVKYSKLGAKYLISNSYKSYAMDSLEQEVLKKNFIFEIEGLLFYSIDHLKLYEKR